MLYIDKTFIFLYSLFQNYSKVFLLVVQQIAIFWWLFLVKKIIFQEVSKLNKVEHNHPMLSLDKTKSIDAVKSFLGIIRP